MAKKEKEAKAAPKAKAAKKDNVSAEEKAAKRKARMEALKNRPHEQRTNSKQIDVIDLGDGKVVKNYGYPVKNKSGYVGVLVTSVSLENDKVTSTSVTFIPGSLTVKAKKGHGTISSPKAKGEKEVEETEEGDSED